MQRLLATLYKRFGNMTVELEGFEEIRFKNLVIAQACRYKIKDCTEQALALFKQWMKTNDPDTNNM